MKNGRMHPSAETSTDRDGFALLENRGLFTSTSANPKCWQVPRLPLPARRFYETARTRTFFATLATLMGIFAAHQTAAANMDPVLVGSWPGFVRGPAVAVAL